VKNIGFITTNKVLAQSLAILIKSNPDLELEPFLMLNLGQAALDAEIMGIDIAVVEVIAGMSNGDGAIWTLCNTLRRTVPNCQILLLVQQDDPALQDKVLEAIKNKSVDDFVFCDSSLDYLLAKLLTI